ncbi:MAG: hypothetical protein ACXVB9_05105 [Bdellovibrionota bacterium]
MTEAWDILTNYQGTYRGNGVNHEGQAYQGRFELTELLSGRGFELRARAESDQGELYHDEVSWIAPDLSGDLHLYVMSSNHPGVTPHLFHRIETGGEGEKRIVFRFGLPENDTTFREEITIACFGDGSVEHRYAWGLPGGAFETRSGSRMNRVNQ